MKIEIFEDITPYDVMPKFMTINMANEHISDSFYRIFGKMVLDRLLEQMSVKLLAVEVE